MIARIWHGYTANENADKYEAMLKPEPLPGINQVRGYLGCYLLRRPKGSEVEFVTVLLWESLDALRAFAGPDYELSIVPLERRKLLSHYDECPAHYDVIIKPGSELSGLNHLVDVQSALH